VIYSGLFLGTVEVVIAIDIVILLLNTLQFNRRNIWIEFTEVWLMVVMEKF
jgi:hypothetical protein